MFFMLVEVGHEPTQSKLKGAEKLSVDHDILRRLQIID